MAMNYTRLTEPLVREGGELRPATWDEALSEVSRAATSDDGAVAMPDPARTTRYQERALRFRHLAGALAAG